MRCRVAQFAFPQQSYIIKDNIIAGTQGGGPNVQTYYNVTGLSIDGNVYDPQASFAWNSGNQSLAAWRAAADGDQAAKQCAPAFVNASTGNFRLGAGDTCAKAAGVSIASHYEPRISTARLGRRRAHRSARPS